ncbi:MAG TPA: stage III sporulation protein AE [Clostridia bacterium]|nr:stage III sporulation protein AE [Clostridia bacterium]
MTIKRQVILSLVLLMVLLTTPNKSYALMPTELREGVQHTIEDTNLQEWNVLFNSLPEDVRTLWGSQNLKTLVSDYALGEGDFWGSALEKGIREMFKNSLPQLIPLILQLLAVAILSGFLRAMGDAGMSGLNDIAGFVCQCFAICIALSSFLSLIMLSRETIAQTSAFIELSFPLLLTLLTAAGGITSAGIFQPAMSMLCSGVTIALQNVVLPVTLTGGVMGVLNNITGRVQLGQFFSLSKSVAKWLIGLLFTLYSGVTTLQGMSAATFDGISIRTAKFALDKLVPIVGGMVSGTVDTMLGCAVLVKNAVGLLAIILAFSIACIPLMRIGVGMLTFRFAAAVCEPIADPRLPKMLASLADVLTYLFAATVSLSVMFMITVGLVMSTGNTVFAGG